jgi:predicted phosphoribosyltransferase
MSVIGVRKLPYPDNPEAGFGAIAEDGSIYLVNRKYAEVPSQVMERIIEQQTREMKRRIQIFRAGSPLASIAGKIVIVIDDGVTMGSTMQAAIGFCRNQRAKIIVAAAPAASQQAAAQLAQTADEAVILETPDYFYAVAQAYEIWYDVPDDEVLDFLHRMQPPADTLGVKRNANDTALGDVK